MFGNIFSKTLDKGEHMCYNVFTSKDRTTVRISEDTKNDSRNEAIA